MKINLKKRIAGKRINLRKLSISDTEDIYQNLKDRDVSRWAVIIPYPYTRKMARDFIHFAQKNYRTKRAFHFAIELKETKHLIGIVGLEFVDYKNKIAEIGVWLGKNYWGKGYGTEALGLIVDFAFNILKLNKVFLKTLHPNPAAIRIAEKMKFKFEGRFRQDTCLGNKYYDHLYYGLLRSEYKHKKG